MVRTLSIYIVQLTIGDSATSATASLVITDEDKKRRRAAAKEKVQIRDADFDVDFIATMGLYFDLTESFLFASRCIRS